MNLCEATMKYGCLIVFIRSDFAEIWRFRYGLLTLVIGTLKILAGTGVFVRVVCALGHSTKNLRSPSSMMFTYI